ncbi:hypothetical protein L4C37_22270 [Vibrio kagoshimensis]|uniref:hypothetical protein n=1 Tax=Vibrio kagoshimensis TaxID=2910244 RepID=UPI003D2017FE
MKNAVVITLISLVLSGCSSKNFLEHTVDVEPVTQDVQSICVNMNPKVQIPFHVYIKDIANENGYVVVNKECYATVDYVAVRYFDVHAPLANATVTIVDKDNDQVGYMFYQQPRNMWTSSDYFKSDEEILLPILNDLFPNKDSGEGGNCAITKRLSRITNAWRFRLTSV